MQTVHRNALYIKGYLSLHVWCLFWGQHEVVTEMLISAACLICEYATLLLNPQFNSSSAVSTVGQKSHVFVRCSPPTPPPLPLIDSFFSMHSNRCQSGRREPTSHEDFGPLLHCAHSALQLLYCEFNKTAAYLQITYKLPKLACLSLLHAAFTNGSINVVIDSLSIEWMDFWLKVLLPY